jgi:hypothetical protein
MAKQPSHKQPEEDQHELDTDNELYDDFELLEHLESLREEMQELGVTSLAEIEQRIHALHRQLDKH